LNQTNTFTSNRYAVKRDREQGPPSEKPKAREMVVKKKVSGEQVSGFRSQVSGKNFCDEAADT